MCETIIKTVFFDISFSVIYVPRIFPLSSHLDLHLILKRNLEIYYGIVVCVFGEIIPLMIGKNLQSAYFFSKKKKWMNVIG